MKHAPGAGLIALPADQQSSMLTTYVLQLPIPHMYPDIKTGSFYHWSSYFQVGGIRGTVVARWTTDQQVEWSILRQGHDSLQNSSHLPRLSPAQYSLNSAELWPKTPIISYFQAHNNSAFCMLTTPLPHYFSLPPLLFHSSPNSHCCYHTKPVTGHNEFCLTDWKTLTHTHTYMRAHS